MKTVPPKPERLAAFSDGVIAVIITIMVLDLKAPLGANWQNLLPLWPTFLAYALSYLFVGVFWSNHHYLLQEAKRADHLLVGANLFSLFTISLIPFCAAYLSENKFAAFPMAVYAGLILIATFGYVTLQVVVYRQSEDRLEGLGKLFHSRDWFSVCAFITAIPAAYLRSWLSFVLILAGVSSYFLPNSVTLSSENG